MDYRRLAARLFSATFIVSIAPGCVTHHQPLEENARLKFIRTPLAVAKTFSLSEQYLEWQRGFEVQVRDTQRGLLVTGWVKENPSLRYRITLRITPDERGSVISTHIVEEDLVPGAWRARPTNFAAESQFLADLNTFLQNRSASKSH